ncbi:MAG: hypothetical protein ABI980_09640 [Nitrospirota bacterium]
MRWGGLLLDQFERLHSILRDHSSIIGGLQTILEHRGNVRIVVDDEDFGFHLALPFVGSGDNSDLSAP